MEDRRDMAPVEAAGISEDDGVAARGEVEEVGVVVGSEGRERSWR